MMTSNNQNYFYSGPVTSKKIGKSLGKLIVKIDKREEQVAFELLDCFNQSIRKKGCVLLRLNNTLMLLLPSGQIITQNCPEQLSFISLLADGVIKNVLSYVSPLRSLMVVSKGRCKQFTASLLDNEQKTQSRVHLYTFTSSTIPTTFTLASLVYLRGYSGAHKSLLHKLDDMGFQAMNNPSIIYEKLIADYDIYEAKPNIIIGNNATAYDTANVIIRAYLKVAQINKFGMIVDIDTEFLHDYRVSLRKIRSVVSLFKGVYSEAQRTTLKTLFSDLMAPTGRLRDLDVYLLEREMYFQLLPTSLHEGLEYMFKLFEAERNDQHKALIKYFKSPSFKKQMSTVEKLFFDDNLPKTGSRSAMIASKYATSLIWKCYRKVCKIARSIDENTPDEEVHELRIQCKKLRYLIEFFSTLFDKKEITIIIKSLKVLQNTLGLFNDYSVQQDSLKAFIDAQALDGTKQDRAIAQSVGALITVLHQRQLTEREKVASKFMHFDNADTQTTFKTLFKR
ncbi:MAG: metal-binding protein [Colwellia sp.]|nr:MAG: metal-binding protein [Colwellia sp.]